MLKQCARKLVGHIVPSGTVRCNEQVHDTFIKNRHEAEERISIATDICQQPSAHHEAEEPRPQSAALGADLRGHRLPH